MPALFAVIRTQYAVRSHDSVVISRLGFQSCPALFIDDSLSSRHFKYTVLSLKSPNSLPHLTTLFFFFLTDAGIVEVRQSVQGHKSGKARIWIQFCSVQNRVASTSLSCICHGTLPFWGSFSLWNENDSLTCLLQRILMEIKWSKIF